MDLPKDLATGGLPLAEPAVILHPPSLSPRPATHTRTRTRQTYGRTGRMGGSESGSSSTRTTAMAGSGQPACQPASKHHISLVRSVMGRALLSVGE